MLTCREAEKMVIPYINDQLSDEEMEEFLNHIHTCADCREELEIYYAVYHGLKQLDSEEDDFDSRRDLEESLDFSWLRVRTVRLRRIIRYAVDTLGMTGLLTAFFMQMRIWIQTGI